MQLNKKQIKNVCKNQAKQQHLIFFLWSVELAIWKNYKNIPHVIDAPAIAAKKK